MSLFTQSQTKAPTGSLFRAVAPGSGRVDFSGTSDARGLLHAIADASVRHRVAVLGYEPGATHPTIHAREGGSSISSRPDLTTVEQTVLAQIRIFEDMNGHPPSVDEVAELRSESEARLRDLLGDREEAATPLQKVTVREAIESAEGRVSPEQRELLIAAAVRHCEEEKGEPASADERREVARMIDEQIAEAKR